MPAQPYSELSAAEQAAHQRDVAAAAALAARAPTDSYNASLNVIDRMASTEEDLSNDISAYRADTDGFRTEADSAVHNRKLTRVTFWTVLCLVPVDAFLALSGIARQVLEWISGIVSSDGRGWEIIPTWAVISTATILSIALWALTLLIKAGTSTVKQKARLQLATAPLEIRRLNNKIRWKIAGRAAYLICFGFLLWTVHKDARRRIEWMQDAITLMRQQAVQDQQMAASVLGGSAPTPTPVAAPASAEASGGSFGAEAFVLAVLFALHAVILCVIPSFSPVNPFGPKPFTLSHAETTLAQSKVTKSRMLRELWDQLNDMPQDQRQRRVDAMPARVADMLNAEFGRRIIITAGAPAAAGAGGNVAPAPTPPPPTPAPAPAPAPAPMPAPTVAHTPVPPAPDNDPIPDPHLGVL